MGVTLSALTLGMVPTRVSTFGASTVVMATACNNVDIMVVAMNMTAKEYLSMSIVNVHINSLDSFDKYS